ncbi:signal transduction histidine kinase [Oxalobacteraceae bacterium GrIS 1.11]
MKLFTFIHEHTEQILIEWDAFARSQFTSSVSELALRDHAGGILRAVACELESGRAALPYMGVTPDPQLQPSAAAVHGAQRQASNFSLLQLSAEYRALRATVLRLWLPQVDQMSAAAIDEMVRFNQAIDQALAESITTYTGRAEQTRDLFLAILGHDLRAPLSTVSMVGDLLMRPGLPADKLAPLAARVKRSARLMSGMVDDLLGYTRSQLGGDMPMTLQAAELGAICRAAIDDAKALHPASQFELQTSGDLSGSFDPIRLHQLFTNLFINAAQFGTPGVPAVVDARGEADAFTVVVNNVGCVIPEESLHSIFQPLIQLVSDGDPERQSKTSLGLGLYVAREIAVAHQGTLSVSSSAADGTAFTVRLPRPK